MIGTPVGDGYIVLNHDSQAAERELKRMAEHIRRLIGKRLVIADGRVVTAYRTNKATERRLIRKAEDRELTV